MPKFIVFEGLDGSGKSTLIEGLVLALKKREIKFQKTREPGGTPLAEKIRHLILKHDGEAPVADCELLLYAASRAQHVAQVIKPALSEKSWVICDRFSASTIAFQVFARGIERKKVEQILQVAEIGVKPDLYVLVDVTVAESRHRLQKRNQDDHDRMERERDEFHEKVRQGYLAQAKENPQQWLVLDGMNTPEVLCELFLKNLQDRQWLV